VIVDLDARPEAGDTMVVGDVVNTAARLQSARRSNGVLVGARPTRDAVDDRLRGRAAGRRQGKTGRSRLVALAPQHLPGQRALSEAPLVGRERELERSRGSGSRCARSGAPPRDGDRPGRDRQEPLAEEFAPSSVTGRSPLRGRSRPTATAPRTARSRSTSSRSPRSSTTRARTSCARSSGEPPATDELTENLALLLGFETERADRREPVLRRARSSSRASRATADAARLRGHPLGRSEPARPDRGAERRDAGRRRLLIARAHAARALTPTARLGRRALSATSLLARAARAGDAASSPQSSGERVGRLRRASGRDWPRAIPSSSRSSRRSSPSGGASDAQDLPTTIGASSRRGSTRSSRTNGASSLDASVPARSSGAAARAAAAPERRRRRAARRARGARADPARGRLAHPGRAAVLVQARLIRQVAYASVPRRAGASATRASRASSKRRRRRQASPRRRSPTTGTRPATSTARSRTSRRPPITPVAAGRRSARSSSTTRRSGSCRGRRARRSARREARRRVPGAVPRAGCGEPRAGERELAS
jgi:hypothetical protein